MLGPIQRKRHQLERAQRARRSRSRETRERADATSSATPCSSKPSDPTGFRREFRRQAFRCSTRAELDEAYERARPYDPLVQELIPGGDDELYTLGSYLDRDGEALGGLLGPEAPADAARVGTCRVGEAVWVDAVVEQGLTLLRGLGFHGLSQVEFKRDPRDGAYKLMEVNPRLFQWHGLAAACGVDLPRVAYFDLLGDAAAARALERQLQAVGDHAHARLEAGARPSPVRRRHPRARRPAAGRRHRVAGLGCGGGAGSRHDRARRLRDDSARSGPRSDRTCRRRRARRCVLAAGARRGAERRRATVTAASRRPRVSLDPLDPPLERLRAELGLEPPRWRGARFAVALTHDVDTPWRWTRAGIRLRGGQAPARRPEPEAGALARVPLHRVRGTDPNWSFQRIAELEAEHGARSTFFVMAGHAHAADGAAPEAYDGCARDSSRRSPTRGAEIGLHGSYTAAEDAGRLAAEKQALEALAGPIEGHRYHYLRVDPAREPRPRSEAQACATTDARLPRRARFPRRHRSSVSALGSRARPPARPRRDPAGGDGRDPRRGALPRAVRAADAEPRLHRARSTGRRSTAAASRSSGTPTVSTRATRARLGSALRARPRRGARARRRVHHRRASSPRRPTAWLP